MVKIKRTSKPVAGSVLADTIEGCELHPITTREGWPKVARNIIANTYYRVTKETDKVRCLVTIMPDGLKVAWDTCAKCHDHITLCVCRSGIYQPASVGYIRATYEVNYPTERPTDYSEFFDPYDRKGGSIDRRSEIPKWDRKPYTAPSSIKPRKQAPAPIPTTTKPEEGGLTVKDIENLDLLELNKQAKQQAKKSVRRARSIIRGGK